MVRCERAFSETLYVRMGVSYFAQKPIRQIEVSLTQIVTHFRTISSDFSVQNIYLLFQSSIVVEFSFQKVLFVYRFSFRFVNYAIFLHRTGLELCFTNCMLQMLQPFIATLLVDYHSPQCN